MLDLGTAYVDSQGLWEVARPHMEVLSAKTDESCSVAQLDGSDIVYVARVAVPKIVALVGADRHPVPGAADLAGQGAAGRPGPPTSSRRRWPHPSRSGLTPLWQPDREERDEALREVRARGWAMTDQQLALGIRSVAVPVRDGEDRVVAALNVNTHAAETSVEYLLDHHLPLLQRAAGDIGADFARLRALPRSSSGMIDPDTRP